MFRPVVRAALTCVLVGSSVTSRSQTDGQRPATFDEAIELRSGDFIHLEVSQEGMDVVLRLRAPDGAGLEIDDEIGVRGQEALSYIASTDGAHRLVVRPAGRSSPRGTFQVRIDGPRPATPADRDRLRAERAVSEGLRLRRNELAASRRQAIESLAAAVSLWRSLGDTRGEARALGELAAAQVLVGDADQALDLLAQAAPLWTPSDHYYEGMALNLMAKALYKKGRLDEALARSREALAIRRATLDRWNEAETLQNLAALHGVRGDVSQAIAYYEEAVAAARSAGNRLVEGWALTNLGNDYIEEGQYQKSLDTLQQGLVVHRATGIREGEGLALNNLGLAYRALGEPDRALEYFERALAVWAQLDSPMQVLGLRNVGESYGERGRYAEGRAHLDRALEWSAQRGDRRNQALTLGRLGQLLENAGDQPAARERFQEALTIRREMGDRPAQADALQALCRIDLAAAQTSCARAECLEAIEISRAIRHAAREASGLHLLARVDRAEGRWREARLHIEEALGLLETLRRGLRSHDLRTSYAAVAAEAYELQVDVLMTLHGQQPRAGLDRAAFEAAERGRARSLLELLVEGRADPRAQRVDETLEARHLESRRQLQEAVARQARLLTRPVGDADVTSAAEAVAEAERVLSQVEGAIQARSRGAADPQGIRPLAVATLQQDVLDAGTVLLAYALGEQRSYVWAVGEGSFASSELPPRGVLEPLARRAYATLSRRGAAEAGDLAELGRLLLGPVANAIEGKRLVVVADGALQYLPFAALPDPSSPAQPLLVGHEIVGLPAASVVSSLRRETPARARAGVAILADPVFDARDERLGRRAAAGGARASPASEPAWRSSARDVGLDADALPRLPFSRWEARTIARLARRGEARVLLDFEASRRRLDDPALGRYRYLHFATHGFFNPVRPELSGLVLSLVDRDGRPQEGFVTALDLYGLALPADVVVLSGCRTALGRDVRGEGLVGLTRAFMYAGARTVIASLWPVDDAATAELMAQLYEGLLRRGLRPAAALREAQIHLWRGRARRSPYFWAAFQIQGDWN
jgi:CHAT domain-containing protein/Tfp pilus assembly protein PilF